MIREAKGQDVPAIIDMVAELHRDTRMALPIDTGVVRQTLHNLIVNPSGLVLVSGKEPHGFIAASVGITTVSLAPVGIEHGWWASPTARGAGYRLLMAYERWGKQAGCLFIRMCTPPHTERAALLLRRCGFFLHEEVWVKAI